MLNALIEDAAEATGLGNEDAARAVCVLLATVDHQGLSRIEDIYQEIPEARALVADMAAEIGLASDPIARLIEQTPGGRRHVGMSMFSRLHEIGLGHGQVADLMGCVRDFAERAFGIYNFGHLSDVFGMGEAEETVLPAASAVA